MKKEQIIASARIFAKLRTVLDKRSDADLQKAAIFPLKMMVIYNKEAAERHVLTQETQDYLAKEYSVLDLDDYLAEVDKPLSLEDQGIWQLAYYRALHEMK